MSSLLFVLVAFGSWGLELAAAAVTAAPAHGTLPQGKLGAPSFSSGQGFQADLAARKRQEALEKERLAILAAKAVDDLSAQLPKAKSKLDENWKKAKAKVTPADLDLTGDIKELANAAQPIKEKARSEAASAKGTHDSKLLKTLFKLMAAGTAPSVQLVTLALAEVKTAAKLAHGVAASSLKVAEEMESKPTSTAEQAELNPNANAAVPISARIQARVPSAGTEKEGVASLAQHAARFNFVVERDLGSSKGGSDTSGANHDFGSPPAEDSEIGSTPMIESGAPAAPAAEVPK